MEKKGLKWEGYGYELNQMEGVATDLPAFLINVHTIDSLSDAMAYLDRLGSFDKPFTQTIENIKFSQSKGIVPPAFTFPYVKASIEDMIHSLSNENDNVLINDFKSKIAKASIPDSHKAGLINVAKKHIAAIVIPSYKNLGVFWEGYSSMAKASPWGLESSSRR